MHGFSNASYFLFVALISLILCMSLWFRDIISEGTYLGNYTLKVQRKIIKVALYLVSEAFFFLAIFWAYFHSASYTPAPFNITYCFIFLDSLLLVMFFTLIIYNYSDSYLVKLWSFKTPIVYRGLIALPSVVSEPYYLFYLSAFGALNATMDKLDMELDSANDLLDFIRSQEHNNSFLMSGLDSMHEWIDESIEWLDAAHTRLNTMERAGPTMYINYPVSAFLPSGNLFEYHQSFIDEGRSCVHNLVTESPILSQVYQDYQVNGAGPTLGFWDHM